MSRWAWCSFQALALVIFALGRDPLIAVGGAIVVYVARAAEQGVVYPIWLLGTSHTYGVLGLSMAALCLAALGAGAPRAAALLIGLAPSVHVGLGLWVVLIVAGAGVWNRAWMREWLVVAKWPLVLGLVISAVVALVHSARASPIPAIDAIDARRYFDAFVTVWDGHRQPVPLSAAGVRLTAGTLLLAVVWLRSGAAGLTADAAQLLRILAVASAGALAAALTTYIPVQWLPQAIVVAMPGRLLNLTALLSCPVLIGLAANLASRGRVPYLLAAALVGLIVSRPSQLWTLIGLDGATQRPRPIDLLTMAAVTASIAIWALVRRARTLEATGNELRATETPRGLPRALAAAALVVGLVLAGGDVISARSDRPGGFHDGRDAAVFAAARGVPGLLATAADLHVVQLRTRRPLLLDGSTLDVLPYSIEGAAQVARILRDLHGVDLFDPPAEARLGGRVPPLASRAAWTSRTRARWTELKRQYGVTQVVAFADWTIDLPMVAEGRGLRLYDIPD